MNKSTQKKSRKSLKILSIILITLAMLIIVATIVIGNYFVNYALVPNQGAENRDPASEDLVDDVPTPDNSLEGIIDRTRDLTETAANNWLDETEHLREARTIITADDLTLHGHAHLQENPTKKWVVVVHGYQSD